MLYLSVSVRPSVRPCSPFPIDNLSIYSRNFFKFCIHIVIGDEWYLFVCLFVFVALRPMSTAMVIAGRSVHLTTLFPGQA